MVFEGNLSFLCAQCGVPLTSGHAGSHGRGCPSPAKPVLYLGCGGYSTPSGHQMMQSAYKEPFEDGRESHLSSCLCRRHLHALPRHLAVRCFLASSVGDESHDIATLTLCLPRATERTSLLRLRAASRACACLGGTWLCSWGPNGCRPVARSIFVARQSQQAFSDPLSSHTGPCAGLWRALRVGEVIVSTLDEGCAVPLQCEVSAGDPRGPHQGRMELPFWGNHIGLWQPPLP